MGCDANTPRGSGRGRSPQVLALYIKSFAASEYAAGQRPEVLFGNLPARTPDGRYGHLLGFELEFGINYDVNATSLAAAINGWELFGLLDNFSFRAGGVDFFGPGIDGRDLRWDYYCRNGVVALDDPADVADTGVAAATATVRLRYNFGSTGRPRGLMDCAIPLAMLDHRADSNDKLEFDLRSTLKGVSVAGGFTLNSYSSLVARARVAYTEDPYIDAHWYLQKESTAQLTHIVEPRYNDRPVKIEYVMSMPRLEDGGAADLGTEYAGTWNVRHGDFPYATGRTTDEMDELQRMVEEVDWVDGRTTKAGGSYGTVDRVMIVPAQPWIGRSDLGSPQIYLEHSVAAVTTTTNRHQHRQVFVSTEMWRAEAKCRLGREGADGVLPGPTADVEPKLLPQRLVKPETATAYALTGKVPK